MARRPFLGGNGHPYGRTGWAFHDPYQQNYGQQYQLPHYHPSWHQQFPAFSGDVPSHEPRYENTHTVHHSGTINHNHTIALTYNPHPYPASSYAPTCTAYPCHFHPYSTAPPLHDPTTQARLVRDEVDRQAGQAAREAREVRQAALAQDTARVFDELETRNDFYRSALRDLDSPRWRVRGGGGEGALTELRRLIRKVGSLRRRERDAIARLIDLKEKIRDADWVTLTRRPIFQEATMA
ncbi:hypothetical protein BT69DRAFT_470870 [Atractiella rhizophila]|nr:hypothetical protein BT69DRAFT_470870 [Atractiella rhizophila]